MIHTLIAVKDAKVGSFARPVPVVNAATGVRAFADAVNDPSTEYHKHPEDYTIWELGTFDDQTGLFQNSASPTLLANAVALNKTFE